MINKDFDLTLTEISEWESNFTLPVTTKLIDVLIRNENKGFETACTELTDLEDDGTDHWGFDSPDTLGRHSLTQLSPTQEAEPGTPIILIYRHPETKSTKVTGLLYDSHCHAYLIKII